MESLESGQFVCLSEFDATTIYLTISEFQKGNNIHIFIKEIFLRLTKSWEKLAGKVKPAIEGFRFISYQLGSVPSSNKFRGRGDLHRYLRRRYFGCVSRRKKQFLNLKRC